MEFIKPLLPNIVTGFTIGSTLGGCFLFYKFYEDYKRKVMYQKLQEQMKNITKSASLAFFIYLMIRGKVSKIFVKTIVSQYLGNHENINEINIAIDQISEIYPPNTHFDLGLSPTFIHPTVIPGPTSPFYNPDNWAEATQSAEKKTKATGLNFTSKKVKKQTKKPNPLNPCEDNSSDDDTCHCPASYSTDSLDSCHTSEFSKNIKVNI